jgi:hypothetical protein
MSKRGKNKTIHVGLPTETVDALDRRAKALGLNRGAYARMLLIQMLREGTNDKT